NFWGIAYNDDPGHRYAGVTTFKRGFGGEDVTYIAAHDFILHSFRYKFNWLIETIRRKKRKL
ncbi:MAG TPA: methicillin resistance protein, partial [Candidatus Saccharibacteria bacterium]|nr:methicillin resistance protein [Candidatus Saccharibacteria bacterium]